MKKFILFILAVIGIFSQSFAQTVPNSGFENWQKVANYYEPVSWQTSDTITALLGATANVNKETAAAHVHGGTLAAKIQTQTSSILSAIPGAILCGQFQITGFSLALKGGFPCTERTKTFTGWYQYSPGVGDSAWFLAYLFKRNASGKRDTVAVAQFKTNVLDTTTFTQFSIDFAYNPNWAEGGETPDSALILVSSSSSLTAAKLNSLLWVDDLSFSTTLQGIETVKQEGNISLYPNPASSIVTFKLNSNDVAYINVYNLLGKKVKTAQVNGLLVSVSVNNLDDGLYFYQLANKDEQVLSTGKFSVKK